MPSPRPKPFERHQLAGFPGKRKPKHAPPKAAEVTRPRCPVWLGAFGKREFRRIAPILVSIRTLTTADLQTLAAYCAAYQRWRVAERDLAQHDGLTYVLPNGCPAKRPELEIIDQALRQMHRFATELGITPSARTKVHAVPQRDDRRERAKAHFGA